MFYVQILGERFGVWNFLSLFDVLVVVDFAGELLILGLFRNTWWIQFLCFFLVLYNSFIKSCLGSSEFHGTLENTFCSILLASQLCDRHTRQSSKLSSILFVKTFREVHCKDQRPNMMSSWTVVCHGYNTRPHNGEIWINELPDSVTI